MGRRPCGRVLPLWHHDGDPGRGLLGPGRPRVERVSSTCRGALLQRRADAADLAEPIPDGGECCALRRAAGAARQSRLLEPPGQRRRGEWGRLAISGAGAAAAHGPGELPSAWCGPRPPAGGSAGAAGATGCGGALRRAVLGRARLQSAGRCGERIHVRRDHEDHQRRDHGAGRPAWLLAAGADRAGARSMIPHLKGLVLGGMALFAAGYAVRALSPSPGIPRAVQDSLASFRADNARLAKQNDSLRADDQAAQAAKQAAHAEGARGKAQATIHLAAADTAGRTADGAHAALAMAMSCADSLPAALAEAEARKTECAELRQANADLGGELEAAAQARARAEQQLADRAATIRNDSTQLGRATILIGKLERAARGCRWPIIGLPCAVGVVGYDATDHQLPTKEGLYIGASVPLKRWLNLTVTYRPFPR